MQQAASAPASSSASCRRAPCARHSCRARPARVQQQQRHIAARASGGDSPGAPGSSGSSGGSNSGSSSGSGSFWRDLLDFESWAPKSTKIWRLQQYPGPGASSTDDDEASAAGSSPDASMDVLAARISELRDSSASSSALPPGDDAPQPTASFSDADDEQLAAALGRAVRHIATTSGSLGASMDEEQQRQPLTGEEIRQLLLTKYGKQYDLSFVRRDLPGMGAVVSLNIMWLHAAQASFRMTQQQYCQKLDSVAQLVNELNQTDKVRAFLLAPARSQKGLPRRPVVGTAISIRLDLSPAQVAEWFSRGYD